MLYDKEFLSQLDQYSHKVVYARITALTFQETPIEYIEGRVTQGSINIDGSSAVRRSCSLTIAAPEFNYNDYYWGLNTKFKLEIGLENNINTVYPDIIWFKQGIYLITSFNTSRSTNNFTISIQGKDKMCLLNGEIGGSLESSVDFGTIEEEDANGNWVKRNIPIQEIIKNAVHTYAKEPYHNIIINDLDTYGLELLEYRYDTPMYLYRNPKLNFYDNVVLEDSGYKFYIYDKKEEKIKERQLSQLSNNYLEMLVDSFTGGADPYPVYDRVKSVSDRESGGKWNDKNSDKYIKVGDWCYVPYIFAKIEYGQTAGYRLTDLTYAGDLIANVGESITSVLDKIRNMLTEFEYFYNLDGQFVFQKKQSFKETIFSFNNQEQQEESLNSGLMNSSDYSYEFYGGKLITAFNNNPNLLNLRNDYSVWGEKETISGAKIPVHLRYAIDKKPISYKNIRVFKEEVRPYNQKYNTKLTAQGDSAGAGDDVISTLRYTYIASDKYEVDKVNRIIKCDWREVIYQMAKDYYKYNFLDDFELKVAEANLDFYPTGRTGYEQYYIDMQSFWRQLYYPTDSSELKELEEKTQSYTLAIRNLNTELYGESVSWSEDLQGGLEEKINNLNNGTASTSDIESYINDYDLRDDEGQLISSSESALVLGLLQDIYFRKQTDLNTLEKEFDVIQNRYEELSVEVEENYYIPKEGDPITSKHYWNRAVYEAPDQLNFWFNFLDTQGELQQFNVQTIGSRPKAINDSNIKSIYFRETPSIIYGTPDDRTVALAPSGYRYIQVNGIDNMFSASGRGKSAKERLDELIYQHGYCIENATITSIPIYYLQPNTRIYLQDKETNLDGDYIVSKFTIPLTYNGTMSITATKAAENNF